jgi:hypothetical protein
MVISVKASCTAASQSEKVWYVESCLGKELKGIASFPPSTSSPRNYSIRRNYWQGCIFRGRVSSAVLTSFSFWAGYTSHQHYYFSLLSTHPPFFLAGWLTPTHRIGYNGDFDLRTMPADSKLLNSALAICNFSGLRQWDFAKTEGWLQVWM